MGEIGIDKILLIGLALLIFFGPKKLPELGRALGKGIQEFKKASRELSEGLNDAPAGGEPTQAATQAANQTPNQTPNQAPRPDGGDTPGAPKAS